jgi:Fe-S-cluster containining protein
LSRFTTLPDPFVAALQSIPGFLELTTGYTLCSECERCERSVVYLTPREQDSARSLGLRLYGRGGATRINRQGCKCPFYDRGNFACKIYADRPLICNLFPFDIIEHEDDGSHWWVLFGGCEEVRRGKVRGRLAEARRVAAEIDRRMPPVLKAAFVADAEGAVYEAEFYRYPIHYLLPLTLATAGDGG